MGLLQEAIIQARQIRNDWRYRTIFPALRTDATIDATGVAIKTNRRRSERRGGAIGTEYYADVDQAEAALQSQGESVTQAALVKAGLGTVLVVEGIGSFGRRGSKTAAAVRVVSGMVLLGSAGRDATFRLGDVLRKQNALRRAKQRR